MIITRPTKNQVESLVGKEVTITLFDNSVHQGILDQTESNLIRYGHPGRYHVNGNLIFRASHIEKIVSD